jgi:hypothetical protein
MVPVLGCWECPLSLQYMYYTLMGDAHSYTLSLVNDVKSASPVGHRVMIGMISIDFYLVSLGQ